jgi:cystathionine beta-lyase/cystathionine gamma-synthase
MLSFEPRGGAPAAERMFSRLSIPLHAPSLGGPETLVTRPAASSHAGLSAQERARIGISDGLVRVSIGLEAADDLIEDFAAALKE